MNIIVLVATIGKRIGAWITGIWKRVLTAYENLKGYFR